ncbi:MAG: hypothetical protein J5760_03725, partial [Clostridia bacterium]|nr:hypothetical protein [Clostridia bacterium]
MKNDILNSAVGGIDDDILRSAGDPLKNAPERPARKRRIKTWHIVAACHVIAAALAVTALIISLGGKSNGAVAESSSEETAVAFTKEAKLYFGGDEYARAEELTFEAGDIGGYLGEAEITEGENSAKAGFYAINGVSPEIAAAAKMPGGGYTIYFNSSYSAQTLGDLESGLSLNGGSVVPAERLDAEQLAAFIVSFERAQSATNRAGAEDIGEIINNYSVNVGALQGTVGFTTKDYVVANFFGKETAFKADEEETEEGDALSQIFAKIVSDKYAHLDQDHDTEEFLESLVQAGLYRADADDTRITNTTPQWLYELYGAQVFWVQDRYRSYIWYNGEIYDIGGIGSMSGVGMIPCDFDHDGCVDLLTDALYGSGISGIWYGVFNMKTCESYDVTRFMTLTRSVGCIASKDGSYYIYERRYEENGWSAPRITGQLIAYPSEPSGVRYVEFDKHFQEGLGIETRLDGFDIIDVVSYWNSLKESSGKDFFTLEEIYAECANLAKQNVAYDKNGPDSGKYVADIVLLGENVAETKDVLDLMLFTVENCFAEYTYSDETQLYGGIRVISYAKEIG